MIDRSRVEEFLAAEYGMRGDVRPLGGENENFLLETDDGSRYVLKLAGEAQSGDFIRVEREAIEAVAAACTDITVPRIVPSAGGTFHTTFRNDDATHTDARLIRFVVGTPWHELSARPPSLRSDLGRLIARVQRALTPIDDPAIRRTHRWDLTKCHVHRSKVSTISDPDLRIVLHRAFALYKGCARPFLADLPHAYIHADLNDENLLVDGGRIVGILDFGDSLYNPVICDLATSLAYVLLDENDPLQAGAEIVSAYHASRPLKRREIEVLFPLMCGRLAASLVIAAERRKIEPDHPDWFITEKRARKALTRYVDISPVEAARLLSAGTGVEVYPDRGATLSELLDRREHRISGALSVSFSDPVKFVRGRMQFLFDEEDRPFLDLYNNVCHVGHTHPRVVRAGQEQMARLNTNSRYVYDQITDYAEKLCSTLPDPLQYCFFVNSGSEANEVALRLARAYTGRKDMLVVEGAYHGHTNTLIDISPYKFMGPGGTGKPVDWVHIVPMADGYRGTHKGYGRETGVRYADDLQRVMHEAGDPICAFITESLWSCGGQIIPPDGYLEEAFRHVHDAGGLCIIDEVQVGFGRVGRSFWGFQLQNVVPDIVVMGKPIGNGHPLGAVVTTKEIASAFAEKGMEFFSTFGGNPVSCAIGTAVLDVVQEENLQENADRVGGRLLKGLREIATRHPIVGDVRGIGLFIGIELVRDRDTLEPATDEAKRMVDELRRRRVLTGTDGLFDNVVKIKPPIILNEADADMAVDMIDETLAAVNAAD